MWTLDDLKTDRDTQITAICIGFFLIAFPLYFSIAASGVDATSGLGGVRDYEVSGELTYVELASGGEYIADGTTFDIENLHTDAIDGADDMNIVGVRLTMTYGADDETGGGLGCAVPGNNNNQADTISGNTEPILVMRVEAVDEMVLKALLMMIQQRVSPIINIEKLLE